VFVAAKADCMSFDAAEDEAPSTAVLKGALSKTAAAEAELSIAQAVYYEIAINVRTDKLLPKDATPVLFAVSNSTSKKVDVTLIEPNLMSKREDDPLLYWVDANLIAIEKAAQHTIDQKSKGLLLSGGF